MNSAAATDRIRGLAADLGHYTLDHVKWVANPRHLLDWGHGYGHGAGLADHLGLHRERKSENE